MKIHLIGKPTHFKLSSGMTACGLVANDNVRVSAYDGRDVNCSRCLKTNAYKKYMGEDVKK